MRNYKDFLKKIITDSVSYVESIKPYLLWDFKYRDGDIMQYKTKINLSGRKHLYLVLTKRKLSHNNKIHIYLEIFLTVKKVIDEKNYLISRDLPDDKNYIYKNIGSLYLPSYPDLFKLYGIIKYSNYLTHTRTKELFINDMIEWTKNKLIPWHNSYNKDSKWNGYFYECIDTKYEENEIYIKTGRRRMFIILNGKDYKHFVLNNILLKDSILFNTIEK